jgi:sugar O-acyltransferase (sialic acid O-acetyltransferase NeuD family)
MPEPLYLLGGGGHGRVVLDALLQSRVHVDGVLDPKLAVRDRIFDVPILGGEALLEQLAFSGGRLVNGVGANPHTLNRKALFERMKGKGRTFQDVRHPSAIFGRGCQFGEGIQIMAGVVLQTDVRIGANAVINTRATVDHDCVIGAHAFISPGAVLCGHVVVEDSAFIGAGALLIPGVRIGAGAIVGAGAVVTRTVPEGSMVAGNPAARINRG